jgi:hypothetical protein
MSSEQVTIAALKLINREGLSQEEVRRRLAGQFEGMDEISFHRAVKAAYEDGEDDVRPRRYLLQLLQLDAMPTVRQRGTGRHATFEVDFRGAVVDLGTSADLLTPNKVEAAFLGAVGWAPPLPGRAKWRPCANVIARAAEKIVTTTEDEETLDLLSSFLGSSLHTVGDGETERERERDYVIMRDMGASRYRGGIYVRLPRLVAWLAASGYRGLSQYECAARLSKLGWKRAEISFRLSADKVRKVRVWEAPEGYEP